MVEGFIDSASAYEIVLVFARKTPKQSFRMEWDCALEVTALLVSADHIKLAPSPRREGAASGAYGVFLEGLEPAVSRIILPDAATVAAIRTTKEWANRSRAKLQSVVSSFTDTSSADSEAAMWLDSHVENEWYEHVLRRGSLFDHDFLPQIAKTLGLAESEVLKLWNVTRDADLVADLARRRPDTDQFHLIRKAFVTSALLRGRYHDYAAQNSATQILAHPVRQPILRKINPADRIAIRVSNTERYLANIVVAGAFSEKSHEAKVGLWVENVLKLRKIRDELNLDDKTREEKARDYAIDVARKADIRVHSKLLETTLDVGVALSSTALTSFVLHPWPSMIAGTAMYALSVKARLGKTVAKALTSLSGRMNRLSRLVPGRIAGGRT